MSDAITLSLEEAEALAVDACLSAGAGMAAARSLAAATVSAEASGNTAVGFSHLLDYLAGFREGRIDGHVEPLLAYPAPALIRADARGGISQLGFDQAFDVIVERARSLGIALFAQNNSYTSGELGYYAVRLARRGLVAMAFTTGPALMTVPDGKLPLYCTNPLAFAAPCGKAGPLLVDQASSATAFVNIRRAAERGETIPEGFAVDETGQPTRDARAALRGALLTFGGSRGANIALMVEVMASGLGAANWSMDAPGFTEGAESPGAGLTVIAIDPVLLDPDFESRLAVQIDRLENEGVHIPGRSKADRLNGAETVGISLPKPLVERLRQSNRG